MRSACLVAGLTLGLLAGCSSPSVVPPPQGAPVPESPKTVVEVPAEEVQPWPPMLPNQDGHRLSWKGYDGTGDPNEAVYTLNDREIGNGQAGLDQLKTWMAQMEPGTKVYVVPYYSGEPKTGGPQKYPFDLDEMGKLAAHYELLFLIPKAG